MSERGEGSNAVMEDIISVRKRAQTSKKQKMKRKNFKKREKLNEKRKTKNIRIKEGNDCNICWSKAEQNWLVFV